LLAETKRPKAIDPAQFDHRLFHWWPCRDVGLFADLRKNGSARMGVLMAVFIREAHVEDKDALGALKLRSSLAWGDHIEELQALPEAREVPIAHVPHAIVAELEGEIVGFVTVLSGKGAMQAILEDLFVAPEVWRMGVGRKLLAEAEYRAAMLGARTLHVVAGERARPFYEAAGYRFAGTIAADFAPAVRLLKDLP
jgi:GNAT superfamily N-acetyltransferase